MTIQIGVLRKAGLVVASLAFVLAWSSGFLVAKIGTFDASILTLLVWRFLPLALALLGISWARGDLRHVAFADLRRQSAIGLLGQFGYCVSVYAAIAVGVASGTTALIDAVQPIVMATLVGPVLGLRVPWAQWLGLLIGSTGVLLVVVSQAAAVDTGAVAFTFPALAMLCLIVGTLLDRRAPSRLPVLTTLTVHVSITAFALVLVTLLTGTFVPPASTAFWAVVSFAALIPTVVGYGLYWWLLRRVGVTALNALLFLVAPATAVAGTLMFAEPFSIATVVGFGACAGGVTLVLVSEARSRPAVDSEAAGARPAPKDSAQLVAARS